MAINPLQPTDLLLNGMEKLNSNFDYLDMFIHTLPNSLSKSLAWYLIPGTVVDIYGASYTSFTRASTASYFNSSGSLITLGVDNIRQVSGLLGTRSALKLEGLSTNLFTESVITDTNSDGVANTWVPLGLAFDRLLTITPSGINGSDQKILTANAINPTGAETFTTDSISHINKDYVVSAIIKITRGET